MRCRIISGGAFLLIKPEHTLLVSLFTHDRWLSL
jgi:hypothetical protein